jgi:hypothetical protein
MRANSKRRRRLARPRQLSVESLEKRACPAGVGLTASYFDNLNFTGTTKSLVSPTVNFDWGTEAPVPGIGADTFSVRWEGTVTAISPGNYQFQTNSDDGVRLWINGNLVINNWTNHTATLNTSSSISLGAGQTVPIKMEYYDNRGAATAKLSWKRPGQSSFQIIPETQLSPTLSRPALIHFDATHFSSSRAQSVVDNLALVKSRPFDGIVISSYAGDFLLDPDSPFVYDNAASDDFDIRDSESNLGPLSKNTFSGSTVQHNYAKINAKKPGDFFDDAAWSTALDKVSDFARAAREKGFEGIMFDNEDYGSTPDQRLFDWRGYKGNGLTAQQYLDKARQRGREFAQAITSVWSNADIWYLHSPSDLSFLDGLYSSDRGEDRISVQLNAAMAVGIWEGRGAARVIDGQEFYGYGYDQDNNANTPVIEYLFDTWGKWDARYRDSKYTDPLGSTFDGILPAGRKQEYADTIKVSAAVYDKRFQFDDARLTPTTATDTRNELTWALQRADHFAWYYSEYYDFLVPDGTDYGSEGNNGTISQAPPAALVDAIAAARETSNRRTPGTRLYNNAFEGGTQSQFTPDSNATWSATSTTRNGVATTAYTKTGTGTSVSIQNGNARPGGAMTRTDYAVDGWVRVPSGGPQPGDGYLGAGILGRVQDANNYYSMYIYNGPDGIQNWEIGVRQNGRFRSLVSGSLAGSYGTWYALRLKMNGRNLEALISTDGNNYTVLGSTVDTTFTSGRIGLMSWGNRADFDDLRITAL